MPAARQSNSAALKRIVLAEVILAPQTVTATGNSAVQTGWADVRKFVMLAKVGTVTGTTPSATIKLQDSLDGTNWRDVPGGAFAAITATNGFQYIALNDVPMADQIRIAWTVTGTTPNFANVTVICTSWAHGV